MNAHAHLPLMEGIKVQLLKGFGYLIACVVVVGVLTTGCTGAQDGTPASSSEKRATGEGDTPVFDGPWASEFSSAYRTAKTDFEREALSDGAVSDAEFADMETRFRACMQKVGVRFTKFKPTGGYEFQGPAGASGTRINAIADRCSAASGVNTIGLLYFQVVKNPEHIDDATIIAACLVKKRAVPDGYTAQDYARDAPNESFPFAERVEGSKALQACTDDPLGLVTSTG